MKIYIASLIVLLSPTLRAELREKEVESNVEGLATKHVYRADVKILEVASPAKNAPAIHVNTTYTIIADDLPLYKYQNSRSGASFQRLNFVNMKHAVKLHSSSTGTIEKIFVYTLDFEKTFEAFHIKDGRLIPFSDKELAKYRLARNESTASNPRFWNFFRVRGAAKIDVALDNYGQLLEVQGDGGVRGFEVAGEDRIFKPATAKISEQVTEDGKLNVTWINLESAEVKEPFYIRYAQGESEDQANLVNASGEKALPFQTLPQNAARDD